MSMPALLSALRAAGRQRLSAGTLVTTPVSGSYLFRIDQYTRLEKMVANGAFIKSGTFGVGGHDWRIHCYPNGDDGNEGSISLYLNHASHDRTGDATADYHLSILDRAGKPLCTDGAIQSSNVTDAAETQGEAQNFSKDGPSWGWEDFMRVEDLDKEKHLKDVCLSILCDVTVLDMRTTADYRVGTVVPPSDLHRQLAEVLWESKEGVDVEIEVGGEKFPAHRWMLAARSPVFKAELSLSSAALSPRIRVKDMDAGVFKALLHFIYTDALPKELVEQQEALATMAKPLLVAADRYKLERLKLICEDVLCGHIDVDSAGAKLAFAERHGCRVLMEACMQFLADPGNLEAAVETL